MVRAAAMLLIVVQALAAQATVAGRVLDENGVAVEGARVEFRAPGLTPPPSLVSDPNGRFRAELAEPGEYAIHAERLGYFVVNNFMVRLEAGLNEVTITLNHVRELIESLDVVYSPPAIDTAAISDRKQLNKVEILGVPYPAAQDIRSALPILAGVVQDSDGQIHFNGGSAEQAGVTLDGFRVADPYTGLFDARLSVDGIQGLDLESGRYSADKGQGSAGSLDIQSGMGDDRFRFGATNFIPSVGLRRGLILSQWSPRFTLSGPIARGRAWFSNSLEAYYRVTTIEELPPGGDRNRSLSASNQTRIQVNLAPSNILTATYLVNYVDIDRSGLTFLDPVSTTVHSRRAVHMATIKDQIYLHGGGLIELGFAASRRVIRDSPQGSLTYVITPNGTSGNYFADLTRHASSEQWLAGFTLPPLKARGTHQFSLGANLERTGFDQAVSRHDYLILRADGSTARHVSFSGSGLLDGSNFASAAYGMDRWTLREGLLVEMGTRAEWNQIVRDVTLLPRVSGSWSPARLKQTKIAAGFGLFSDPMNLELLTRQQDQVSVSTFYSPGGAVTLGPVVTGVVVNKQSLKTSRARTYSLSLERMLPHGFYGKASYLRRAGRDGLVFTDPSGGLRQSGVFYVLRNQRADRYDALEFSARRTFAGQYEWVASYTYSRARTNAVIDYSLENPIFAQQAQGPRAWDAPHRFLVWGWAPVPNRYGPNMVRSLLRELNVTYLVEARTGFPFSVVNDERFLAGSPNQRRFPSYFNVNLMFEKKFRFFRYLWAGRFGFNNVTARNNPSVVNNNIDSPLFLTYGGGQRRAFNVRLRLLARR